MTDKAPMVELKRIAKNKKIGVAMKGKKTHLSHGHTLNGVYSPTYHSWQAMCARVKYAERDVQNKHVGRGISMCSRWHNFKNFLQDMGERPQGTTLDREDNDGNCEPGNCKWSTPIEQARNRRNMKLDFTSALDIAVRMLNGGRAKDIATYYGISESLPREIHSGRTWKDAYHAARA